MLSFTLKVVVQTGLVSYEFFNKNGILSFFVFCEKNFIIETATELFYTVLA